MISSVSSTPYSYLSQLQAVSPTAQAAAASSSAVTSNAAAATSTGSASSTSGSSTAQSLVSSLLSGGPYSSEVLSLLQQNSAGSFDPISTLLGGTSTNNALTGLYASLYSSAESASVQTAKADSPATTAAQSNPVENLISAQTQASIAYNQTNQQNAQNIIAANSYGADGVTSLVA